MLGQATPPYPAHDPLYNVTSAVAQHRHAYPRIGLGWLTSPDDTRVTTQAYVCVCVRAFIYKIALHTYTGLLTSLESPPRGYGPADFHWPKRWRQVETPDSSARALRYLDWTFNSKTPTERDTSALAYFPITNANSTKHFDFKFIGIKSILFQFLNFQNSQRAQIHSIGRKLRRSWKSKAATFSINSIW